jgi:hypothetical protein
MQRTSINARWHSMPYSPTSPFLMGSKERLWAQASMFTAQVAGCSLSTTYD